LIVASQRGVGQLEPAHPVRRQIESLIRQYSADPARAALAVCVFLDANLGLAEEGHFNDDQMVLNAIIVADQTVEA